MSDTQNTEDKRVGHAPAGSPIPAIGSAGLNIGTAGKDCASARDAWMDENWNDATMWISNAISQLESARAKIYAHQETENEKAEAPSLGEVDPPATG